MSNQLKSDIKFFVPILLLISATSALLACSSRSGLMAIGPATLVWCATISFFCEKHWQKASSPVTGSVPQIDVEDANPSTLEDEPVMIDTIEGLQRRIAQLESVLKFYAHSDSWSLTRKNNGMKWDETIHDDCGPNELGMNQMVAGHRARLALRGSWFDEIEHVSLLKEHAECCESWLRLASDLDIVLNGKEGK
jgi:hypothetical protein